MDFSGLVKAVQEFWNFVWPPIVCVVLLAWIGYVIAPSTVSRIRARIARLKPNASSQLAIAKTAKRFGFDKLLPVLSAFCILFAMDVGKTMVVLIGDAAPPNLVYRWDVWFFQHSSDERWPCLWAHFGDAPEVHQVQSDIERTLGEAEAAKTSHHAFENIDNWEARSVASHVAFSACKFFILWAALWMLFEVFHTHTFWRPLFRLTMVFLIFFVVGTFFLFRHIWALEQGEYARLSVVQSFLYQKPPLCNSINEDQLNSYDAMLRRVPQSYSSQKWWELRMFDAYYSRWVWNQLWRTSSDNRQGDQKPFEVVREGFADTVTLENERETLVANLSAAMVHRPSMQNPDLSPTQNSPSEPVPLDTAQISAVAKSTITPSSVRQYVHKRILWVDDHPENNRYETKLFAALGMTVDTSTSTDDAIKKLSSEHYNLVITDMMRGSDKHAGYELLQLMRTDKIALPVIIYSSSSNAEYRAEALKRGAIGETNDPKELLQLVTKAVLRP